MEQIKIEHVAPYIPYGLKVLNTYGSYVKPTIRTVAGYHESKSTKGEFLLVDKNSSTLMSITHHQPLLLPLSYLDGDGLLITSISQWLWSERSEFFDSIQGGIFWIQTMINDDIEDVPYMLIKKLLEHHVDVFSLIPKGLALDKTQYFDLEGEIHD